MTSTVAYFDFGDFRLDLVNRLLLRRGTPVALTPKAFETLRFLAQENGRVISKEELMAEVWPQTFVTDATLSQNIYVLRKALQSEEAWIQTLPKRGYLFQGEIISGTVSDKPADSPSPDGDHATPPSSVTAAAIRSLVVLPFRPLPADEDGRFLGLGMADAVITSLSNVERLSVRATSSILRYADAEPTDPAQVGDELGVEGVLEGTVQRLGSQLRVTVQLISVAEGVPCWAESFRGSFDDLFAAQEAIAKGVVDRLRLELSSGETRRLLSPPTPNLEAHRAYVRGRYSWNQRTGDDLRRSIELFRQAIAQDPGYARAYSGLADALILLPFYGSARPADAFRQAHEAARRALELDGKLAEARTSLAYTEFVFARRWTEAEAGFQQAIEADPSYPTACHWYAFLLTALGRHDEARELARRAHRLDPLSLVISTDLALTDYFARRYQEAIEQLQSVLEVAPGFGYAHFGLALCQSELGHHDAAIASGQEAVKLLGDSGAARSALGYALARGGHDSAWQMVRDEGSLRSASHRALVLAGLDDRDGTLEALEQGLEERSRFVAFSAVWPAFDAMRQDTRFVRLLDRLGLHPVKEPS